MENNVCKFIPQKTTGDVINTVNFVYERSFAELNKSLIRAVYMMCLVTDGEGTFVFYGNKYQLKRGDIFFVFPATPYEIISENLKYIYISYIGIRANQLMDRIQITKNCVHYEGYENLIELWKSSIEMAHTGNLDILSEGLLLYTLSAIANTLIEEKKNSEKFPPVLKIKKYIDDNFSDVTLSLEKLSKEFGYNKKYISTIFKENMSVGFSSYLATLRVQNACTLMEEGYTSIKNIAFMCGFSDALYFSKVFKTHMGKTPMQHIQEINA